MAELRSLQSSSTMEIEPPMESDFIEVDHLASIEDTEDKLGTLDDVIRELRTIDKTTGLLTMRCLLALESDDLVVIQEESGAILERFPYSRLVNPCGRHTHGKTGRDSYDNLLIFSTLTGQTVRGSVPTAEVHMFQCLFASADRVAELIRLAKETTNRGARGRPDLITTNEISRRPVTELQVSTKNSAPITLHPEPSPISTQSLSVENVRPTIHATALDQYSPQRYRTDTQSNLDRHNRQLELLNKCFDDIETFSARLPNPMETGLESGGRAKKRGKSKAQKLPPGPIPPREAFIDCLKKFKLAINLLACHQGHLRRPNVPELVHLLFSPLELVVENSRFVLNPEEADLAPRVVSPLLTPRAVHLLSHCLTTKEMLFWRGLGDAWTLTEGHFPHPVPSLEIAFLDGYRPPAEDLEDWVDEQATYQPLGDFHTHSQPIGDVQLRSQLMRDTQMRNQLIADGPLRNQPMSDIQMRSQPISDLQFRSQPMNDTQMRIQPMSEMLPREQTVVDIHQPRGIDQSMGQMDAFPRGPRHFDHSPHEAANQSARAMQPANQRTNEVVRLPRQSISVPTPWEREPTLQKIPTERKKWETSDSYWLSHYSDAWPQGYSQDPEPKSAQNEVVTVSYKQTNQEVDGMEDREGGLLSRRDFSGGLTEVVTPAARREPAQVYQPGVVLRREEPAVHVEQRREERRDNSRVQVDRKRKEKREERREDRREESAVYVVQRKEERREELPQSQFVLRRDDGHQQKSLAQHIDESQLPAVFQRMSYLYLDNEAQSSGSSSESSFDDDDEQMLEKPEAIRAIFIRSVQERRGKLCKVISGREGANAKELTVETGDVVEVLDDSRNWWKCQNMLGRVGYCPYTLLTPLDAQTNVGLRKQPGPPSVRPSNGVDRVESFYSPPPLRRNNVDEGVQVDYWSAPAAPVVTRPSMIPSVAPPPPPPPPPPPMPTDTMVELRRAAKKREVRELVQKSFIPQEQNDELLDELKARFSTSGGLTSPLKRTKPVHLRLDSAPEQTGHWLQSKGFSQRTVTNLANTSAAELFSLNRTHLVQMIGAEEASRLDSLLTVQKKLSGYLTPSKRELNAVLQRRKHHTDSVAENGLPEQLLGNPPDLAPEEMFVHDAS